jgi:alkane 1-monooxygenase
MQTLLTASRFALLNLLCLLFIAAMLAGGGWIWIAYLGSLLGLSAADEFVGDDTARLPDGAKWLYEANLYASLPILIAMTFVALHHFISTDPTGALHQLSRIGIEFESARSHHQNSIIVATILGVSYFYSLVGMIVGHELTHRTTSAVDMMIGHALLGFAFNVHFAIYHVYGHHRNVATYHDPNSARRGEYALSYIVRAMIWSAVEAVQIEAAWLRRRGLPVWSRQNRVLSGLVYPIVIVGTVGLIGGARAAAGIAAACVLAQIFDKLQEYVQHYGLVRVPGTPIEPRHAWDCRRLISNASQYNLARHSDHHINAGKPYWNLELKAGAPVLPFGYLTATLISLFPPLWHFMMDPVIDAWDKQLASHEELDLIRTLGLPSPDTSKLRESSTTGL